jgi:hypothetical protein
MIYRRVMIATSILIAVAALALGYGLEQFWLGSAAALVLGWWAWYGKKKERSAWSADVFFAGVVLLVTIGGFQGLSTLLLFIAILGALGAWDLLRFQRRIGHVPSSEEIPQIEKRHLALLGLTLLIAVILGGVMGAVRMEISFGVTLFLGVLLIITLGEILRFFRS